MEEFLKKNIQSKFDQQEDIGNGKELLNHWKWMFDRRFGSKKVKKLHTRKRIRYDVYIPKYVGNTLDTFNCRVEDVKEKLNHLNVYKSTLLDLLHPRVLRTLEDMLLHLNPGRHALHLNHIFNKSAEIGIIPVDRKSANVTVIHKKWNRHEPGNYRPISLTSVVYKTMPLWFGCPCGLGD